MKQFLLSIFFFLCTGYVYGQVSKSEIQGFLGTSPRFSSFQFADMNVSVGEIDIKLEGVFGAPSVEYGETSFTISFKYGDLKDFKQMVSYNSVKVLRLNDGTLSIFIDSGCPEGRSDNRQQR